MTTTKQNDLLRLARDSLAYASTGEKDHIAERGDAAFGAALFAADGVLDRPEDPNSGNSSRADQLETLLEASWLLGLDDDWQEEAHVQDAVAGLGLLIGPKDHRYPTAEDLDAAVKWAEVIVTAAEKYVESKEAQRQ